jgi:5'-3' exonuclease
MMRFIRFLLKVKASQLFTKTPAHKSSEALKAEAMDKLDIAVTHADFRTVADLLERIIVRFVEDERIDKRQSEWEAGRNAQPQQQKQNQNQNQNGQHHNNANQNQNNGNQQPKKYGTK